MSPAKYLRVGRLRIYWIGCPWFFGPTRFGGGYDIGPLRVYWGLR